MLYVEPSKDLTNTILIASDFVSGTTPEHNSEDVTFEMANIDPNLFNSIDLDRYVFWVCINCYRCRYQSKLIDIRLCGLQLYTEMGFKRTDVVNFVAKYETMIYIYCSSKSDKMPKEKVTICEFVDDNRSNMGCTLIVSRFSNHWYSIAECVKAIKY